jgi:hypothetical protein
MIGEYEHAPPPAAKQKTGFVYELVDPRNGDCKYVGITFCPEKRLKQHRYRDWDGNERLGWWKDELFRHGEFPQMNILEEGVSAAEIFEKEASWCKKKSQDGFDLLNKPVGRIKKSDLFTPADSAVVGDFADEVLSLLITVIDAYKGRLPTKVFNSLWAAYTKTQDAKHQCPNAP